MAAPLCPPGFDCQASNSCPAPQTQCPVGMFCGRWDSQGISEDILGPLVARQVFGNFEEADDIVKRWRETLPSTRFFSGECLNGYVCPNTTTLAVCPKGSWCGEATYDPNPCDAPSTCTAPGRKFQVTFAMPILAGVLTLLLLTAACWLRTTQRRKEAASRLRQSAGGKPTPAAANTTTAAPSIAPSPGFPFELSNLCLSVGDRPLLKSITLPTIRQGELTVVMGPSGAGKTLLLSVLRGVAQGIAGARVSGTLRVGDVSLNLSQSSSYAQLSSMLPPGVLGYVPKADVVDRAATVREALAFSARARLPSTVSNATVSAIVEQTLSVLQLTGVADVVIGGSQDAPPNISGGQLKRVNIGMELVAQPRVLLLDEPTAGLDASVALDLLLALRELATNRGMTVVTVLHQPRAEAFAQFHQVFLLAKGQVAYAGRPDGAVPYFSSLTVPMLSTTPASPGSGGSGTVVQGDGGQGKMGRFVMPGYQTGDEEEEKAAGIDTATTIVRAMNPADWIVDIAAGLVQPLPIGEGGKVVEEGTGIHGGHGLLVDLGGMWRKTQGEAEVGSLVATPAPGASSPDLSSSTATSSSPAEVAPAQTASLGTQLWVQIRRGLVTRLRDHGALALFTILHMFMAVALSSGFTVYIQSSYRTALRPPLSKEMRAYCPSVVKDMCDRNTGDLGFQQLLFFMAFAVGSTCAQAAIGLFAMGGNGPALIKRECGDSGLSTLAFGVGRMVADLTIIAWNTSLFTAVWMLMGHVGRWYYWFAVVAATGFASSGMGYVASLLTRPVNAAVVVMVATVTQSVFSGVEPRLTLVDPLPVVNWAWYLSYAPYVAEATYVTWAEHMFKTETTHGGVQEGADWFGYDVSNGIGRAVGALFGLGLMWRAIALYILWRTARPHSSSPWLALARAVRRVKAPGGPGDKAQE